MSTLTHEQTLRWISDHNAWRLACKTSPLWARPVASGEQLTIRTKENEEQTAHDGDWLCVGADGDPWLQSKETLEAKYTRGPAEPPPHPFETPGREYYRFEPRPDVRNWVAHIQGPDLEGVTEFTIQSARDKNKVHTSRLGGYAVTRGNADPRQKLPDDIWVVQEEVFDKTYTLIPEPAPAPAAPPSGPVLHVDAAISAAEELVSPTGGQGYHLAPVAHASLLGADAAALARVLRRPAISNAAAQFEREDADAIAARDTFHKTARRANVALLIASILSTAIILLGAFFPTFAGGEVAAKGANDAPVQKDITKEKKELPEPAVGPAGASANWLRGIFIALGLLSIVAGILAGGWLQILEAQQLFTQFKAARARAEALRSQYFQLVTQSSDGGAAPAPAPALPLLQLVYFRLHHLDVQMAFYQQRGADHKRAAQRAIAFSTWAAVGASGVALIASFLGAAIDPRWAAVASLGAVGTALALFARTREVIHQDSANADRYRKAADALLELLTQVPDVATAAAAGHREPVQALVSAVNDQIAREHAQWLAAADQAVKGLQNIRDSLKSLQSPLQPQPHEPK
jgi:hypothetical protein